MARHVDTVAVSRVDLPDGRVLALHGAAVVGFNLVEARRLARRGARTREQAIDDVYRREDGLWEVSDPNQELDLVSHLAAAVLFSYAALEGVGNCTIAELRPDVTAEVERDGETIEVARDRMEAVLTVAEKLSVVVPTFTARPFMKGCVLWDGFGRLSRLRDGLVHPRSASDDLGIFGRLLRGDADSCADDAVDLVRALRPELLPSDLLRGD